MRLQVTLAAALTACLSHPALATPEPGIPLYHVGVENRPLYTSGTYLGQSNRNHQRLVMLLSHTFVDNPTSNHFHRIGAYTLTGPAATPSVGFIANDRVPEPYQADDGLTLLPGAGPFAGKLVSGLGPAELPGDPIEQEYGDLGLYPIDNLFQYDGQPDPDSLIPFHPGHYLLNTSGGVYKSSVAGATIGLRLEAISPGLSVHDAAGTSLFGAVGDTITLGTGAAWSFDPVFAVDRRVAPGTPFTATFTLVDRSSTPLFGDSAPFSYGFITVPEPASLGMLTGLAACMLASVRRVRFR